MSDKYTKSLIALRSEKDNLTVAQADLENKLTNMRYADVPYQYQVCYCRLYSHLAAYNTVQSCIEALEMCEETIIKFTCISVLR